MVALIATIGLVGLFGMRIAAHQSKAAAPKQTAAPDVLVEVTAPTRVTIPEVVRFSGTVRPRSEVDVFAKVPGRIQDLRGDVGMALKAGALLAIIEHSELGFQSQQALAQVEAAEAQVLSARLQLAAANTQQQRIAALETGGAVAQSERDRAELGLKSADAGLRAAQAQLKLAQAAAGLAGRALQNSQVTAPIAGTITKRNVSLGSQVNPGQPMFQLQDVTELKLDGAVSASEFSRLALGQTVSIAIDELPGKTIAGTISTLSPSLDAATRRAAIQISIDNSEGRLLSNMFAHAEVAIGQRDNVLTVPTRAIVTLPAGRFVYVMRDGKARAILLPDAGADAEHAVAEGVLTEQDRVIVSGQAALVDGQPVRVGAAKP